MVFFWSGSVKMLGTLNFKFLYLGDCFHGAAEGGGRSLNRKRQLDEAALADLRQQKCGMAQAMPRFRRK
jgi:hypothetical protein